MINRYGRKKPVEYYGITYWPHWIRHFWPRWLCRRGFHLWDEMITWDDKEVEHCLICDVCEAEVGIGYVKGVPPLESYNDKKEEKV